MNLSAALVSLNACCKKEHITVELEGWEYSSFGLGLEKLLYRLQDPLKLSLKTPRSSPGRQIESCSLLRANCCESSKNDAHENLQIEKNPLMI